MFGDLYNNSWTIFRTTIFWEYGKCESHEDELCRDLVNRKMQIRNNFLTLLRAIYPDGDFDGNVFDTMKFRFFLDHDYCGHWISKLQSDRLGQASMQFVRRAQTTFIEHHAVDHLGIPISITFDELARQGGISRSCDERFLLSYKPGCSMVKVFDNSYWGKFRCEVNPLEAHGFKLKHMHPYTNLDGSLHHYVCDYESPEGEVVNLPLTLWETPNSDQIFDWLHPAKPFPLYRRDLLHDSFRSVLLCENEAQVEYLRENHAWLSKRVCLTTWSGGMPIAISGTDWGALEGRWVGIIVAPSRQGFRVADKIYCAMKRVGVGPIGFLMPWARLEADKECSRAMRLALDKDITDSMVQKGEIADRAEFVKDAKERYGLNFDPDFIAAAISGRELLALPVSEAEFVLGPMIMKGDKVLVYAHRGSGKTWLICFVAVACASGMSLFGGRLVAPRPLRVLVIDGEMGARELQNRYSMIFKAMGTPEQLQENLKIIAARIQGKDIQLETPEDRERFKEDIAWADVIIADSMFCLFPRAMGTQIEGAQGFNEFMRANSMQGKTTIVVDHTGKNKRDSYGTIGKELGLELVLKVEKIKNFELFRLSVEKYRNLGSQDIRPIEYSLEVDEDEGVARLFTLAELGEDSDSEDEVVSCNACDIVPASGGCDTDHVPSVPDEGHGAPIKHDNLDSKIIAALKEDPELSVRALAEKVGISKSTVQTRRKQLEDACLVVPKPSRKVSVS